MALFLWLDFIILRCFFEKNRFMKIGKKAAFLFGICFMGAALQAQDSFGFTTVAEVETSSVKSQDRTGTCWAYSTMSFVESEIMRMGGPEMDLSEMYIVKYAYQNKAQRYVLLHGMGNFSQGGQAHDVMNVIAEHGFVRETDYFGRPDTSKMHNHYEMESTIKVMLDNYIDRDDASPSAVWYTNVESILTNYLGEVPGDLKYNKRTYTPTKFAAGLGIDKLNYVELTSYTHHPFYEQFDLEVPDNWSHDRYYNVPIDELINTMKEALAKGYSIVWDGDVSDSFFSHKNGVALLPVDEELGFVQQTEKEVTQSDRQEAFYSWKATDDHLMHITGVVKDKNGTVYFKTKNSWGSKKNPYSGYLYMSEAYVRMNTVAIMLHKHGVDKELQKKLFK
ncbi:aminopeptidase [Labilibacter sediminis]|nr:aminopeptidase [Labilibacter sediminis]